LCHPPTGFISQGTESIYSLDFICRGDGAVFSESNVKVRLDSHILKDETSNKEFDLSFKELTSIRSNATDITPGFSPPSHLRTPLNMERTDYNRKQQPEPGDYRPLTKQMRITPPNSHSLTLSIPQLETMTRILQLFHPKYDKIIIDRVWAFPTDDSKKLLPPRPGEAPRRTLYDYLWFVVKGEGSHYCHNKPGSHESSTIRFIVDYECNIYQSCWSSQVYNGKPCHKRSTKGKAGFTDEIMPGDYKIFVDIFTAKNF
jgi:hypothetical protein